MNFISGAGAITIPSLGLILNFRLSHVVMVGSALEKVGSMVADAVPGNWWWFCSYVQELWGLDDAVGLGIDVYSVTSVHSFSVSLFLVLDVLEVNCFNHQF